MKANKHTVFPQMINYFIQIINLFLKNICLNLLKTFLSQRNDHVCE